MVCLTSLSTFGLGKSFTKAHQRTRVLEDITYTFEKGRSYALIGASGIGKSTLIHLLAGIDEPDEGRVVGYSDACSDPSLQRDIIQKSVGLIFQAPYVIDELSVLENVMVKGLIERHAYKAAQKRASELLEKVGLSQRSHDLCKSLSGGEQQRVAVARALFNQPSFILADEPTAHLDRETAQVVIDLLMSCVKEWRAGLIIASHDPQVAQAVDVVLSLERGGLIEQRSLAHTAAIVV